MKTMNRKASDNKYLHRDFHVSSDIGLAYIGNKYGEDAVKDFICQFVDSYHRPLSDLAKKEGISVIKKYFEDIFEKEEAIELLSILETKTTLKIEIRECPALKYMKSVGHKASKWHKYTTTLLYQRLADNSDLYFELDYYDSDTGGSRFIFKEKEV